MIAVEARGRLGNHMFQFAFGLAGARRLGTGFVMAEGLLREHFRLAPRDGWIGRARRAASFRAARRRGRYPVVIVDGFSEPADVLSSLTDRTTYVGYFQSEGYFVDVRDEVTQAFEPRAEHERSFAARYGDLAAGSYTCCHVRATDYREWSGGVALPPSYYREALARADALDGPIVFVGDDLSEMRAAFAGAGVRFEQNTEAVDLLLLARATTVVTSNSSFGWWGAWLGGPQRRVFAPRYWLGFKEGVELPHAVVPSGWHEVPVETVSPAAG